MKRLLVLWLCLLGLPAFGEEVRIRNIYINSLDVFDPSHEEFDTWYFRLANRFHAKTRASFIRKELLMRRGDLFVADLLRESERNLRRYNFLTEVSIESKSVGDKEVDLYVSTEDQWTLDLTTSIGKSKGARTYDFGIDEENLLGLGKKVGLKYERNEEREGFTASYLDPRFLDTRLRLNLSLFNASDGHRASVSLNHPFYSQSTPWSYGISWYDLRKSQHLYYEGIDVVALNFHQQSARLFFTRAWGERYRRVSAGIFLGYEESVYPGEPEIFEEDLIHVDEISRNLNPPDRRALSFGLTLGRDRQHFIKLRYLDNFGRTEDLPIGLLTNVALIHSENEEGSDYFTGITGSRYTFALSRLHYGAAYGEVGIRRQSGKWSNLIANWWIHYYLQSEAFSWWLLRSPRQTLAFNLSTTFTWRVDPPFQLSLGEDEGLRGYAFKNFNGLNRIIFNFEDRIFTGWENRFVGIGFAPFIDAGYIWGLSDHFGVATGIGIRLGFKKYRRTHIVRIDFAYPLVNAEGEGFSVSVSTGQIFKVL